MFRSTLILLTAFSVLGGTFALDQSLYGRQSGDADLLQNCPGDTSMFGVASLVTNCEDNTSEATYPFPVALDQCACTASMWKQLNACADSSVNQIQDDGQTYNDMQTMNDAYLQGCMQVTGRNVTEPLVLQINPDVKGNSDNVNALSHNPKSNAATRSLPGSLSLPLAVVSLLVYYTL